MTDLADDDALIDGLRNMILQAILDDWPRMSSRPEDVALAAARVVAPLLGAAPPDQMEAIRGFPWVTR